MFKVRILSKLNEVTRFEKETGQKYSRVEELEQYVTEGTKLKNPKILAFAIKE